MSLAKFIVSLDWFYPSVCILGIVWFLLIVCLDNEVPNNERPKKHFLKDRLLLLFRVIHRFLFVVFLGVQFFYYHQARAEPDAGLEVKIHDSLTSGVVQRREVRNVILDHQNKCVDMPLLPFALATELAKHPSDADSSKSAKDGNNHFFGGHAIQYLYCWVVGCLLGFVAIHFYNK